MFVHKDRMKKARKTLDDAVARLDEIARDEELRGNLRSAIQHGSAAVQRMGEDARLEGVTSRIADDDALRRELRKMLDDLRRAADRARDRSTHRLRNALLVVSGSGIVLAAVPTTRHWIADRVLGPEADSSAGDPSSGDPVPVT